MTLKNIFDRLREIDLEAQSLITDTGFSQDGSICGAVCPDNGDPEHLYLREHAERILSALAFLHEELRYLRRPFIGEYELMLLLDGRLCYSDEKGSGILRYGQDVEVKAPDRLGIPRWIRTTVNHNGHHYCFSGFPQFPPMPSMIRIKEGMS